MITPRLLRRAARSALQWRLLFLFWLVDAVSTAVGTLPAFAFLSGQLDHAPRAAEAVWPLEGPVFIELLRKAQEGERPWVLFTGLAGAAAMAFALGPFAAAAMVAAARSREAPRFDRLLATAGELYGRMVRCALVSALPLGAAAGLAWFVLQRAGQLVSNATLESRAERIQLAAALVAAGLVLAGQLVADGARALFAAEPGRRSALVALWAALRLLGRRPLRFLATGAVAAGLALAPALALFALRARVPQATLAGQLAAWGLGQAAVLCLAWGRGTRLFGLAELARADAADKGRGAAFRRQAPPTSPPGPAVVASATLQALAPPEPAPATALSGPDGSGT